MLPFLEQNNLYQEAGIDASSLVGNVATSTNISVFFCPSDNAQSTSPSPNTANNSITGAPVALTNYNGSSGSNFCWGNWPNNGPSGNCNCFYWDNVGMGDGMFFRTDIIFTRTLEIVTDGLSNTLMIGEDIPSLNCWCAWPYANTAISSCNFPPNINLDQSFGICDASVVAADANWANTFGFRSRHPAGCSSRTPMARSISSIRGLTWPYRTLSTIQGGEVFTAS
jgi:hypothetical protein